MDGFKEVNDTYGHDAGDKILYAVGQRLRNRLRDTDNIIRVGGDEFVILLHNVKTTQDVNVKLASLMVSATAPYNINGKEIIVGCSLGVAMYPNVLAHQLIQSADKAMYQAKQSGRNQIVYCDEGVQI